MTSLRLVFLVEASHLQTRADRQKNDRQMLFYILTSLARWHASLSSVVSTLLTTLDDNKASHWVMQITVIPPPPREHHNPQRIYFVTGVKKVPLKH